MQCEGVWLAGYGPHPQLSAPLLAVRQPLLTDGSSRGGDFLHHATTLTAHLRSPLHLAWDPMAMEVNGSVEPVQFRKVFFPFS